MAERLEVGDVKRCATLVDWHDVVDHFGWHGDPPALALLAKREPLYLHGTKLSPRFGLVELRVRVEAALLHISLRHPRTPDGLFQYRHGCVMVYLSKYNVVPQRQVVVFSLEANHRDDPRIGIAFPQLTGDHSIAREVGKVGRVAIPPPVTAHGLDVGRLPLLDLAPVGGVFAATVFQVVYNSL